MQSTSYPTVGVVLAAGAGRRFGGPKALVVEDGSAWVARAATLLRDAGCTDVIVVLGASAEDVRTLVPSFATVVVAADWETGMSASLRAGLAAAALTSADSAVVTLVDLPELPLAAVQRVISSRATLAQATWGGDPGHPVLIGREHWAALAESVSGDSGARQYLVAHGAIEVECGDLGDGSDVDQPVEWSRSDRIETGPDSA